MEKDLTVKPDCPASEEKCASGSGALDRPAVERMIRVEEQDQPSNQQGLFLPQDKP